MNTTMTILDLEGKVEELVEQRNAALSRCLTLRGQLKCAEVCIEKQNLEIEEIWKGKDDGSNETPST